MQRTLILLTAVFLAAILISSSVAHDAAALKGKQKKALKQIDKALIRATEGQITSIDMLNISKKNDSSVIVVINKTGGPVIPVPQPPVTNESQPPITNETQPPIPPVVNNTEPPMPNNLCPPGTHFYNATLCVRDNEVSCPEGTLLNTTTTSCQIIPVPGPGPGQNNTQPLQCKTDEHEENGACVKNPQPPTGGNESQTGVTKVCMVGDLSGASVPAAMKGCDFKVGIGDLGYKPDLSYFKGLKFDRCVIGNHDSTEDGSASIYKEALAYCHDHWSIALSNGNTLLVGLNTNGNADEQLKFYKSLPLNNYKNIVVISHKNGHTFPNAHHPAESKTLYAAIEAVPISGKLFEISGHNHNMASADAKDWFISGAGGRSHYSCGTDNNWKFCDASHYGFLRFEIDNGNGSVKSSFVDTSGKVIH